MSLQEFWEAFVGLRDHVESLTEKHNQLAELAIKNAQEQADGAQRDPFDNFKAVIGEQYKQAAGYTNLVMVAGYAGLFWLLQLTKSDLPRVLVLLVGFLLAASIVFFVVFEVFKMVDQSLVSMRVAKLLNEGDKGALVVDAIKETELLFAQRQAKWWPRQLIPALGFGITAGFILLGSYLFELF